MTSPGQPEVPASQGAAGGYATNSVIDAHQHLWESPQDCAWLAAPGLGPLRRPFDVPDLVGVLDANDIAGTVLVEAGREAPEELGWLLATAESCPRVFGVVGWLDLASPQITARLDDIDAHAHRHWLKGIRAQVQSQDSDYLDEPQVRAGMGALRGRDLAFEIVARPRHLAAAARAGAAYDDLVFVLDHCGKPDVASGLAGLREWRRDMAPLARLAHVRCKLSGLVTEADPQTWQPADLRPFIETALELFGPQRLMFGSDWPVCLLAASYAQVKDAAVQCLAALSAADKAAIFRDTAVTTYRLKAS